MDDSSPGALVIPFQSPNVSGSTNIATSRTFQFCQTLTLKISLRSTEKAWEFMSDVFWIYTQTLHNLEGPRATQ